MNLPTKSLTGSSRMDLDVLENTLSFYIRVLDMAVSRDLDRHMAKLEVARGKGKISALLLVDSHPGIRPSVIAQLTLSDRSATARVLEHLDRHDLIQRKTAQDDSRAQELYVTDKGAATASEVRRIVTQQSESFFRFIPQEEQVVVIDILRRAYDRLTEEFG